MIRFNRVYHPITTWEEIESNMWGSVDDRASYLQQAIELTGDFKRYGDLMRRVIVEWPISCENALTDFRLNRKAWIGHAACALGIGCPEDITRKAWGYLNDGQRRLANGQAVSAIRAWEDDYAARKGICRDVGEPVLFRWDTGGNSAITI